MRKKDFEKALRICNEIIKQSEDSQTLANAWVIKGTPCYGQKEWDSSLLAYLHVPVFYHDEKSLASGSPVGERAGLLAIG